MNVVKLQYLRPQSEFIFRIKNLEKFERRKYELGLDKYHRVTFVSVYCALQLSVGDVLIECQLQLSFGDLPIQCQLQLSVGDVPIKRPLQLYLETCQGHCPLQLTLKTCQYSIRCSYFWRRTCTSTVSIKAVCWRCASTVSITAIFWRLPNMVSVAINILSTFHNISRNF